MGAVHAKSVTCQVHLAHHGWACPLLGSHCGLIAQNVHTMLGT